MLELVVFDVDGLMLDTESVWKKAFDKAGDKYGIISKIDWEKW